MIKQKRKSYKKHAFFIIMFPNGEQVLVKSPSSWTGLIPYTDYIKEKFNENTFAIPINWFEAIKFILKGRVFDVGK